MTPLVHLYRGELCRMTSYRIRLDTTTNWAVGTNAAILSLVLSDGSLSVGAMLPLTLLLNLMFLYMEARRYRGFELIRSRVRLLEVGLYARELGSTKAPDDWAAQLCKSLETPRPPRSYVAAASVRLRRTYMWLIGLDYLAWGLGIWQKPGLEAARLGSIPGIVMLVLSTLLLVVFVVLATVHSAPEEG